MYLGKHNVSDICLLYNLFLNYSEGELAALHAKSMHHLQCLIILVTNEKQPKLRLDYSTIDKVPLS